MHTQLQVCTLHCTFLLHETDSDIQVLHGEYLSILSNTREMWKLKLEADIEYVS